MLVNLTDVFTNEGRMQELTVPYEPETFTCQLGTYTIKEKTPVVLKLSNAGQSKANVEGSVELTFGMECGRCLRDVDYTFDLSFSFRVLSPDCLDEEESEEMEFVETSNFTRAVLPLKASIFA